MNDGEAAGPKPPACAQKRPLGSTDATPQVAAWPAGPALAGPIPEWTAGMQAAGAMRAGASDAVFYGYQPAAEVKLGTVADLISSMMAELLQGKQPSLEDIATVLTAIQEGKDIYRPAEPVAVQLRQVGSTENFSFSLVDHLTDASRAFRFRRSSSTPQYADSKQAPPMADDSGGAWLTIHAEDHFQASDSDLMDESAPLSKQLAAVIHMALPLDLDHQPSACFPSTFRRLSVSCLPQRSSRTRRWSVELRAEPSTSTSLHSSNMISDLDFISCGSLLRCPPSETDSIQTGGSERAVPSSPCMEAPSPPQPSTAARRRYSRASNDSGPKVAPIVVVMDEVEHDLQAAEQWQWDAFHLADTSKGHALSTLGYYLIKRAGLISHLHLNPVKLARYLRRIEQGYRDNPYHNAMHGADVLQSMHVLLHQGGMVPGLVAPQSLTLLACYLAAIIHDFEHPGVSAEFLVTTGDPLAVRYNDSRPLENHHVAAAFALLLRPEYNFLSDLSKGQFASLRKMTIDLVLATDMKSHYSLLGQFKAQFNAVPPARPSCQTFPHGQAEPTDLQLTLALQMAIKCADLGHTAAALPMHLKWVDRLQDELFRQGDVELAWELPVSPMCDRSDTTRMQRGQVAFFDVVVIPLFRTFSQLFVASAPQLTAAMQNRNHWAEALPTKE